MNDGRRHGVRIAGAKPCVSSGSALAIAVSNGDDRSLRWAIVDRALAWMYVIYFALFRS
jgi:hypothetical protein